MKKIIFILTAILITNLSFAQTTDEFVKKMKIGLRMIDSAKTSRDWANINLRFGAIAEKENHWLPYYYKALAYIMETHLRLEDRKDVYAQEHKEEIADNNAVYAKEEIDKAISLYKETSETWVIKKMIISLQMLGDPTRFSSAMPEANAALEKAKKLDPNNPRVYLLEGEDKYNTPTLLGGGREEAKVLFEKSKELFEKFKPESSIYPNWGLSRLNYYLSQYK